jgi:hypothetical protein
MASSGQVISLLQGPLPDNTQQTNIHAPGGIQTHDHSRQAAIDLHLRPLGHWDQCLITLQCLVYQTNLSFTEI